MSKLNLTIDYSEKKRLDKLPDVTLKYLDTKLTSLFEQTYNQNGSYPSLEELEDNFKLDKKQLKKFITEKVEKKLEARGLPKYFNARNAEIEKLESFQKNLEPLFVMACNKILDPSSSLSFNARLKELAPLGIDSRRWSNWLKDKRNLEYAETLFNQKFDKEVDLNAKMSISRNILAGDLQSIKFYYELTNKFRPNDPTQVALIQIIQQLMNIISKHVSPEIIDVIADELEHSDINNIIELK